MWERFDEAVGMIVDETPCECGCGKMPLLQRTFCDARRDEPALETWRGEGHICEWEHRIGCEKQRDRNRGGRACVLFGRECPGGIERARQCRVRFERVAGEAMRS
ncbi:hypothetical protein LCGC14_1372360, partial [marine sediment metagenome]